MMPSPSRPLRVLVLGATGTAGGAVARAVSGAGHEVVCFVRPGGAVPGLEADIRTGQPADPASLRREGFRGERFDAVVSCLASRTGVPEDAWAVDYHANAAALEAAQEAGASQFVMLSAICVQKPLLAFQHAKLTFERELMASGLNWSIVRPTAFFKSLAGQVERVRRGKPFLVFGDGRLTACKPISDDDLGAYIAGCLTDPARQRRILPIGGPGPAITPLEQGEMLFSAMGRTPRFRHVPVGMIDGIGGALGLLGRVSGACMRKAELARIGRYYATESMLVLDPETGRYDAEATPETGRETLADFYDRLVNGTASIERGAHAVF